MKSLILLSAVTLFTISAFAEEGRQVSYKSGDETVQATLYTPKGKGPFPALVVIHEWWGLDNWVKEQAAKFADAGYLVLAIDLYRGKSTANPEEAHELMRGVPEDRAKRDLRAAFDYLKLRKDVKGDRIGSIGWCMGGGYSLDLALEEPTLAADVIHYGHLATDPENLKKINAPVLGIFAGQDKGISPEDVTKFEQAMRQLGKQIEIKIYPDAGHAFENPANKDRYRSDDAADAWKRTLAFLDSRLKK
ncbi:MAG TPA: dienelactone hydrolase family protein [Terriglobales bacterium]|nr:dienelactone hydrolase family protein [Terriglobales bacterium]